MSEDIHQLAARANQAMQAQPGFISCKVHSAADRVLAYSFADHLLAHTFQQQRALLNMPAIIQHSAQTVVLVTHR